MPKITVEIEWDTPDEQQWLNADNVAIALHSYCKNTKFQIQEQGLNPSESVYGFVAWLTTRPKRTIMSATDDAGVICDLVKAFCKANNLAEPRDIWPDNLVHPVE